VASAVARSTGFWLLAGLVAMLVAMGSLSAYVVCLSLENTAAVARVINDLREVPPAPNGTPCLLR
jgi:hypothetical protein